MKLPPILRPRVFEVGNRVRYKSSAFELRGTVVERKHRMIRVEFDATDVMPARVRWESCDDFERVYSE